MLQGRNSNRPVLAVNCYLCGETGHLSRQCTRPRRDQQGSSGGGECYLCHQQGHWARVCPNREQRNERGNEDFQTRREMHAAGTSRDKNSAMRDRFPAKKVSWAGEDSVRRDRYNDDSHGDGRRENREYRRQEEDNRRQDFRDFRRQGREGDVSQENRRYRNNDGEQEMQSRNNNGNRNGRFYKRQENQDVDRNSDARRKGKGLEIDSISIKRVKGAGTEASNNKNFVKAIRLSDIPGSRSRGQRSQMKDSRCGEGQYKNVDNTDRRPKVLKVPDINTRSQEERLKDVSFLGTRKMQESSKEGVVKRERNKENMEQWSQWLGTVERFYKPRKAMPNRLVVTAQVHHNANDGIKQKNWINTEKVKSDLEEIGTESDDRELMKNCSQDNVLKRSYGIDKWNWLQKRIDDLQKVLNTLKQTVAVVVDLEMERIKNGETKESKSKEEELQKLRRSTRNIDK